MIQQIKRRLIFWKDYYPTKAIIYRNRGSTYSPELTEAVRLKFDELPNTHQLATGEETCAVGLDYVLNDNTGQPFLHFVEAEDGQLIPFKFSIKTDEHGKPVISKDESGKKKPEVETVLLENKDERLNFWVDHLKHSETKYTVPGWIAENKDLALVGATGVAIMLIFAGFGQYYADMIPYLDQLTQQLPSLSQAIQSSGTGATPPPGQ